MHKGDMNGEWEDILFRYNLSDRESARDITLGFRISTSQVLITEWSDIMDDLVIPIAEVCIDLPHWRRLMYHISKLQKVLLKVMSDQSSLKDNYAVDVGNNYYVTVEHGYKIVNLRRWYLEGESGKLKPSREGLYLLGSEWRRLLSFLSEIAKSTNLRDVQFCNVKHKTQLETMKCANCNPNTYVLWQPETHVPYM